MTLKFLLSMLPTWTPTVLYRPVGPTIWIGQPLIPFVVQITSYPYIKTPVSFKLNLVSFSAGPSSKYNLFGFFSSPYFLGVHVSIGYPRTLNCDDLISPSSPYPKKIGGGILILFNRCLFFLYTLSLSTSTTAKATSSPYMKVCVS